MTCFHSNYLIADQYSGTLKAIKKVIKDGVEVVHAIRKETRRNGSLFGFSVIAELKQLLIE